MRYDPGYRPLSIAWLVLVPCMAVTVVMLTLSACETRFPGSPPPHRLLQELNKWPEPYYWLVETGVSSRVMGIRAPGAGLREALARLDEMLSQVKEQWGVIGALDTAAALIDYLRQHELDPIAAAIETTLTANRAQEPTGEFHRQLQIMAIKRGLISAYEEVKKERQQ